jgi:hypothetical protein
MFINGRQYTVQFNGVAATVQQDLFEIVAAAGKVAYLNYLLLSQLTEVKDAEEEMLLVLIKSGQTTSGSGGSAPTPVPVNVTDAAAGFTAEVNNTTKATAGTIVTHHAEHWNVRMPLLWVPPPNLWIPLTGARRATVELATTPADSITIAGTLGVFEVG